VQLSSQKLAFDVSDPNTGRTIRYLKDETLFIKDRSDDGKIGRSVLSRAAEAVNVVYGTNSLAGSLLRNGAFPSGFLTAPGAISEATAARLKAQWDSNYARENAGKIAIAGDGLDWKSLSLSPENVELLESRRFGVLEIARIFGVPPIFCGDYSSSTFTNSETALRLFASFTLGQWAVKIQQEFSRSVLSAGYEMQFDLSAFLRGDPAARWSSYNIAIERGILTRDEVRAAEGYGPLPKGQGPVDQGAPASG
jgi:HK97 family phage portal protein